MPNNIFNQIGTQLSPTQVPFGANLTEIQKGVAERTKETESRQEANLRKLKTPNDFRKGIFNRPDLNNVQAAQSFRAAIEAGELGIAQQFIDSGILDNMHESDTRKALSMIQSVKDVQNRLTPRGIETYGGMRRILREGLPGQQKPQVVRTAKGREEKLTKAPERKEFIAQKIDAASGDERTRLLREESELQQAFKGTFGVEKPTKVAEQKTKKTGGRGRDFDLAFSNLIETHQKLLEFLPEDQAKEVTKNAVSSLMGTKGVDINAIKKIFSPEVEEEAEIEATEDESGIFEFLKEGASGVAEFLRDLYRGEVDLGGKETTVPADGITAEAAQQAINQAKTQLGPDATPTEVNNLARQLVNQ